MSLCQINSSCSIHHKLLRQPCLYQFLRIITHVLGSIVGTFCTTAENNVDVRITLQPRRVSRIFIRRRNRRLTVVSTMLLKPSLPTLRKTWPDLAARHASMAIPTLPSVEFLKPVGIDNAEVSSLWTCDSVVRAPIAPQDTRSAVY